MRLEHHSNWNKGLLCPEQVLSRRRLVGAFHTLCIGLAPPGSTMILENCIRRSKRDKSIEPKRWRLPSLSFRPGEKTERGIIRRYRHRSIILIQNAAGVQKVALMFSTRGPLVIGSHRTDARILIQNSMFGVDDRTMATPADPSALSRSISDYFDTTTEGSSAPRRIPGQE